MLCPATEKQAELIRDFNKNPDDWAESFFLDCKVCGEKLCFNKETERIICRNSCLCQ